MKDRRKADRLMSVAVLIIMMSFLYLFAVTFFEVSSAGVEHSKTIVGFLLGMGLGTLLNFYWGGAHKEGSPPPTDVEKTG